MVKHHFLEKGETSGQGVSEGEYCEFEEMKEEYYEHRGWVDGVVPDEKLADLKIEIGLGTGVSATRIDITFTDDYSYKELLKTGKIFYYSTI